MRLEHVSLKRLNGFVHFRHLASKETKYVQDVTIEVAKDIITRYAEHTHLSGMWLIYNDAIVGELLLINRHKHKQLYINSIAVLHKYAGTGAAQMLMETAIQVAKDNHSREIELVVRDDNHRAISFYQKYGFTYSKHYDKERLIYIKLMNI